MVHCSDAEATACRYLQRNGERRTFRIFHFGRQKRSEKNSAVREIFYKTKRQRAGRIGRRVFDASTFHHRYVMYARVIDIFVFEVSLWAKHKIKAV